MSPRLFVLFLLASLSGLLLILGGILLLYKRRIDLGKESSEATTLQLPFGLKVSTSTSAMVLFFIGSALVMVPIYQAPAQTRAIVQGRLEGNALPIEVYAVVGYDKVTSSGNYSIELPDVSPGIERCKILYLTPAGQQLADDTATFSNAACVLAPKRFALPDDAPTKTWMGAVEEQPTVTREGP